MSNISEKLQIIADSIKNIKQVIIDKGGNITGDITTYADSIRGIGGGGDTPTPSRPSWTGHADVDGLRAIGWTDEDIAYYQENGVNWNEEDDQYHLVTDDNKALYGVLTADNISEYKGRIVYLPKIDTSGVTDMSRMFSDCKNLQSIPLIDTSMATDMSYMFFLCYSLTCVPLMDTSRVADMSYMFDGCRSLVHIPMLNTSSTTNMMSMLSSVMLSTFPAFDTSNVINMEFMFSGCLNMVSMPSIDTSKVTNMNCMFNDCNRLESVDGIDMSSVTDIGSMFQNCNNLKGVPPIDCSKITNMSDCLSGCRKLHKFSFLNTANVKNPSRVFTGCTSIIDCGEIDYKGADKEEVYDEYLTSCYALQNILLKNVFVWVYLYDSPLLSKHSLLYLINNEAATENICVMLHKYAYERLANDTDIEEALANHPKITLMNYEEW